MYVADNKYDTNKLLKLNPITNPDSDVTRIFLKGNMDGRFAGGRTLLAAWIIEAGRRAPGKLGIEALQSLNIDVLGNQGSAVFPRSIMRGRLWSN